MERNNQISTEEISNERIRNTWAWAASRIGTLSGAEVIVAACEEAIAARNAKRSPADAENQTESRVRLPDVSPAYVGRGSGPEGLNPSAGISPEPGEQLWVLTFEVNAYDQEGEYFERAWGHKPSEAELLAAGVAQADIEHVLTGGGRRGYENRWQFLRQQPETKPDVPMTTCPDCERRTPADMPKCVQCGFTLNGSEK